MARRKRRLGWVGGGGEVIGGEKGEWHGKRG